MARTTWNRSETICTSLMKLSVHKELSGMPWKACVFFSKDWHIHVDIQIWYPTLGETQPGNPTELCLIFNSVLDFIYQRYRHRLRNWRMNPFLQPGDMHRYAEAIYNHGAPLQNCFGFIDGTLREIARPKYNQRVMYNGHKRVHGIKYQSVVTPNGLIANLSGPFEGKRHDSVMLHGSGLQLMS